MLIQFLDHPHTVCRFHLLHIDNHLLHFQLKCHPPPHHRYNHFQDRHIKNYYYYPLSHFLSFLQIVYHHHHHRIAYLPLVLHRAHQIQSHHVIHHYSNHHITCPHLSHHIVHHYPPLQLNGLDQYHHIICHFPVNQIMCHYLSLLKYHHQAHRLDLSHRCSHQIFLKSLIQLLHLNQFQQHHSDSLKNLQNLNLQNQKLHFLILQLCLAHAHSFEEYYKGLEDQSTDHCAVPTLMLM